MRFAKRNISLLAGVLGLGLAAPAFALDAATASSAVALPSPSAPEGLLGIHAGDAALDWAALMTRLADVDVVFFGEQHGDAAMHRLEAAMLQALHGVLGSRLVLSLEMFERDVQESLDAYLAGRLTEAEFLAQARPWTNYARDYRPLVEYAKANGLRVLAANVPRRIAAQVARQGLEVLEVLAPEDRAFAAVELACPRGRLFERFKTLMEGHPGLSEVDLERMFQAQCLKDATMAESIALALGESGRGSVVFHVNGAFHSDEGQGVPEQLLQRLPDLRLAVTTGVHELPADPAERNALADVIFVVAREKKE